VAVCTFNRHEPLRVLLEALVANAERLGAGFAVGVVVVDDSTDGNARHVAEGFSGRFELGVAYRVSGRQNIALARNLSLETAIGIADWVAMTDDDCEPVPEWLAALLEVRQRTGADAVTGPLVRRVPPGSPRWLTDEPFLEIGLEFRDDGSAMPCAATHNSMVSSRWLREHPAIRFDPALGVTGGEDPVFYRSAHAAGLQIRYARHAIVHENEPPSRATLGYQLRMFFWLGNSAAVTSVRSGVHPLRMFAHGCRLLGLALVRPVGRLARGRRPQLRYGLASVLHAAGMMIGPFGVRVTHR
jgi:succinoglycan biosynthesis protein ExoM